MEFTLSRSEKAPGRKSEGSKLPLGLRLEPQTGRSRCRSPVTGSEGWMAAWEVKEQRSLTKDLSRLRM